MEFPSIGTQCSVKDCSQLDFLPTACPYCHRTFCGAHHSPPETHQCDQVPDNVLSDADAESRRENCELYKCTVAECDVKEVVVMNCPACGRHFCLNHRHENQHECSSLKKIAEETEKINLKVDRKLTKTNTVQAQLQEQIASNLKEVQNSGSGAKSAMAAKLALMKLKGRAKGDNAIPIPERLFFSVDCPNKTQNPKPLDLFLSKRWTMGKVIDAIAREARIKNRNNQADAPKLHVFKDELCLSAPSDRTLNELVELNLIVDGDDLCFKYLPEPE